jgi:hypothetical protein
MEYTEDRETVAELLRKTTRVQLGEAIFDAFHEVQLFAVKYEIAEPIGIDKLDELKASTGLEAHLITIELESAMFKELGIEPTCTHTIY